MLIDFFSLSGKYVHALPFDQSGPLHLLRSWTAKYIIRFAFHLYAAPTVGRWFNTLPERVWQSAKALEEIKKSWTWEGGIS